MNKANVRKFLETLQAANPEPQTELEYSDAYTLLVAVTLSAQATDISVNRATRGLFAAASTPAAMVAHTRRRGTYDQIVEQLYTARPEVIMGGGSAHFLPMGVPGRAARTASTTWFGSATLAMRSQRPRPN